MPPRLKVQYPASQKLAQFNVRIPVDLKRRLLASALNEGRSVQAEVTELLRLGLEAVRRRSTP